MEKGGKHHKTNVRTELPGLLEQWYFHDLLFFLLLKALALKIV
jgi:hypothetical protein